jgi:hypothetical protein
MTRDDVQQLACTQPQSECRSVVEKTASVLRYLAFRSGQQWRFCVCAPARRDLTGLPPPPVRNACHIHQDQSARPQLAPLLPPAHVMARCEQFLCNNTVNLLSSICCIDWFLPAPILRLHRVRRSMVQPGKRMHCLPTLLVTSICRPKRDKGCAIPSPSPSSSHLRS